MACHGIAPRLFLRHPIGSTIVSPVVIKHAFRIFVLMLGPMKKHLLAASGLLAVTLISAAQDSTVQDWIKNPAMGNYKAYAEYKMGKYDSARQIWEVLANRGNQDALFNLGTLAEDGQGEPSDMKKAEALYVAAANAGSFKAQYRLGMLYSAGVLLPKDIDKARRYLGMASEGGDKEAIARLASLDKPKTDLTAFERAELLSSMGKHVESARFYAEAAQGGHVVAQTRLAWLYEAGRGVERSLEEAARLFSLSAEAGDPEAQYALAVMYRTGKGKPQSHSNSEYWLKRSAAQNYRAALSALAGQELSQ